MNLKNLITDIPDFPKPGIIFKDISPLLKSSEALEFISQNLFPKDIISGIDYFAGVESRGFILAAHLAGAHNKGFIPVRKAGKLPPPVFAEAYALEYGNAVVEVNPGKGKVLVVDDVLATGGTLAAALNVCTKAGYDVVDAGVLIDLKFLNKFRFKGNLIHSLVQYE
ncbi:MAG: adenine phosphoribosyltransferase [Bdellovibrionota bacterium]